MSKQIIVIGAGDHAKVVINTLKLIGADILGLTDKDTALHGTDVLGYPVLGGDEVLADKKKENVDLVLGIGSTAPGEIRQRVFGQLINAGYSFATCIHPSAVIAPDVVCGAGTQIMAGVIVNPGTEIGINTILNTRASIDHDCKIGDHVHIAPGVVLAGTVSIGNQSHIGVGASIIQNIKVGNAAMVAAGATVIRDVAASTRVGGTPAQAF